MVDVAYIEKLVLEKIEDTDIFIVEIKMTPGKILVFIDKPTGITIQECSLINKHIQTYVDESGILETHDLEVGSPGMDFPLKVTGQYLRRIGRELKVTLENGEQKTGVLRAISEETLSLEEEIITKEKNKKIKTTALVELRREEIKEAKVVISFKK